MLLGFRADLQRQQFIEEVRIGQLPFSRLFQARGQFLRDLKQPQALTMLGIDLRFDSGKARRELGWSPRPFEEVIRETVDELRARGELPAARPT